MAERVKKAKADHGAAAGSSGIGSGKITLKVKDAEVGFPSDPMPGSMRNTTSDR